WGGLWSFPEYETAAQRLEAVKNTQTQTVSVQSLVEWEVLRHTFTHYHLEIHPLYWRNQTACLADEESGLSKQCGQWVSQSDIIGPDTLLGVPTPVTKLIRFMEKNNE
ncbi:MAG: A/G-specific adenine glycosylase, partial [Gammaproteobacteria bacterium]|nr:A/G-specific adenine glycosylase [Gammaproteobacteria bacterium]